MADPHASDHWHRRLLENKGGLFAVLSVVAISIGSLVEIVPMWAVDFAPEDIEGIDPYTPLEVAGRDIYVREGCYTCHSQWVRPFRSETLRYGEWSRGEEYVWDRPFQLGSRRIGPDLHRIGGKYNDAWHYEHLRDPRSTSPGSIMPNYPWLISDAYDVADIEASVRALAALGTPYAPDVLADVPGAVRAQADQVVANLAESNIQVAPDREVVAMIAYLQRLGKDGTARIARLKAEAEADGAASTGGAR